MKKQAKRLVLTKETLRDLESAKLAQGGQEPVDTVSYDPAQCTGRTCLSCYTC
jgi:hypothetical protein